MAPESSLSTKPLKAKPRESPQPAAGAAASPGVKEQVSVLSAARKAPKDKKPAPYLRPFGAMDPPRPQYITPSPGFVNKGAALGEEGLLAYALRRFLRFVL